MADAPSAATIRDADPEQEEEEEETCGFCIFMKAGGCKPEFTVCAEENTSKLRSRTRARAECEPLSQNWEKCVGQARETDQDFTEGCRDQVSRTEKRPSQKSFVALCSEVEACATADTGTAAMHARE